MPCSKRVLTDKDNQIMLLKQVGRMNNVQIAEIFGVTEGAIRYHVKKKQEGRSDGRKQKISSISSYHEIIQLWINDQKGKRHRQTIKSLYAVLLEHHHFKRSYDALRRYIRKHFPSFMGRHVRLRLETPPGTLVQVDWKEDLLVHLGFPDNTVKVHAFVFTLAFSRKTVVVFSLKKDIAHWLECHQEAFRKLGGLVDTLRPDCVRSAVVQWKGKHSRLTNQYHQYHTSLGINVFPARPGTPTDKGKVEKKISDIFRTLDLEQRIYRDLSELQTVCDTIIAAREDQWRCGATGRSVAESYAYEKLFLRPLPSVFPTYPFAEQRCRVRNDMTVYFLNNYYQVPKEYVGKQVLCLQSGSDIIIMHEGHELGRFPYLPHAKGMVKLQEKVVSDPEVYLSDTVRKWAVQTARRQVDYYQDIISRRHS